MGVFRVKNFDFEKKKYDLRGQWPLKWPFKSKKRLFYACQSAFTFFQHFLGWFWYPIQRIIVFTCQVINFWEKKIWPERSKTFKMTFKVWKKHDFCNFVSLYSFSSLEMYFFCSIDHKFWWLKLLDLPKVTVVTFWPSNVIFKGQIFIKISILPSCMSIVMFLGSRNPNLAIEFYWVHSKVTFVTFQPSNVTLKGQIFLKTLIFPSCISIVMFLGSRNPNFTSKRHSDFSKVTYVTF